MGESLRELFLQLSLWLGYILRMFGTFWAPYVPLGDGGDSVMRLVNVDVDAEYTIGIVMELMTCSLQSSSKPDVVTSKIDKVLNVSGSQRSSVIPV